MYISNKEQEIVNKESNQPKSNRLIRISGVTAQTNLSKSYIYQLCSQGLFPKSVQLVAGGTSVAWVEAEVNDWIESRIQARDTELTND